MLVVVLFIVEREVVRVILVVFSLLGIDHPGIAHQARHCPKKLVDVLDFLAVGIFVLVHKL